MMNDVCLLVTVIWFKTVIASKVRHFKISTLVCKVAWLLTTLRWRNKIKFLLKIYFTTEEWLQQMGLYTDIINAKRSGIFYIIKMAQKEVLLIKKEGKEVWVEVFVLPTSNDWHGMVNPYIYICALRLCLTFAPVKSFSKVGRRAQTSLWNWPKLSGARSTHKLFEIHNKYHFEKMAASQLGGVSLVYIN